MLMKGWRSALIYAATLLLASLPAVAGGRAPLRPAHNYEVHEITLDGAGCRVQAIQRGQAVGWCRTPDAAAVRAFIWTEATGTVDIGTLGGSGASASAIDKGRVVGSSDISGDTEVHAFAWTRESDMLDLGTLGGTFIGPNSVSGNNVVGDASTSSGEIHAFLWTEMAGIVDLGTLEFGTESSARQIHGDLIAGWSTVSVPGRRPVAWRSTGEIIDLLGEPIVQDGVFVRGDGQAQAVRKGLVVGYRRIATTEESRAFAWRDGQGLIDMGVVAGSNESFAFDTDGIWAVGQLSGVGGPLGSTTRAFVWSESKGMRAITPATITAWATHVRNGRVVGVFHTPETNGSRTFLWTRKTGLADVTPRSFPGGFVPAGIDGDGRIAIVYEDEDPLNVRSVILVPRRLHWRK